MVKHMTHGERSDHGTLDRQSPQIWAIDAITLYDSSRYKDRKILVHPLMKTSNYDIKIRDSIIYQPSPFVN